MLGTRIHWLFSKGRIHSQAAKPGFVSLTISAAHELVDWTEDQIRSMALDELRAVFPAARDAKLLRSIVVREHQATLSPVVGAEALRPGTTTAIHNFFIAGDWTRTGLPATIESACISGHLSAEEVTRRVLGAPKRQEVAFA